jgi:UDP-2,3-diacylglucosamine pyrophosphatase LpxH
MSKIIVTSDQHLGYENSNVHDFKRFLDYISSRKDEMKSFVILGDFIDMWRRDASGLFLEHSDIINKLLALRSTGITIYLIAGNHDYHVLKLQHHSYPFEFLPNLILPSSITSDLKYKFKHGWEFDLAQQPPIMEAMCHNMSDEAGNARSRVYNFLTLLKDHFFNMNDLINYHRGTEGYVEHLMTPPEERLKPYMTDVEKKAYSDINDGEVLIFGHTHRPFVGSDRKLVNIGSWVSDAQSHNNNFNTFAELDGNDGNQIKLLQFKSANEIIDITNL